MIGQLANLFVFAHQIGKTPSPFAAIVATHGAEHFVASEIRNRLQSSEGDLATFFDWRYTHQITVSTRARNLCYSQHNNPILFGVQPVHDCGLCLCMEFHTGSQKPECVYVHCLTGRPLSNDRLLLSTFSRYS